MTERTESLVHEVLEKLNIFFRYKNEEYRRAELRRQAEFLCESEKRELSEKEENKK